ncbi:hypothetical protein CC2G_013009 [Coprinopsis cinerea AmutBmut pab1-1]|nr:hypothetical protein CC2G_004939 [Coprinopsis cinerea AmutBmut pab1-1]KAG2010166.1 hypothetical protein CC2G_013009 [Coprinopsis cinerea AmutBmut pab1-1]
MGLRNTFLHLRSFHLLPSKANTPLTSPTSPRSDGREGLPLSSRRERFDNITIRGTTIVVLATLASIVFICSITVALIGRASDNYDQFTSALDEVSRFNPGILLVGEGVDIDIDEPSVTIRWFVVACGGDSVLQGSKGVLDHKACGLPVTGVNIFVDNNANPSFAYDPVLVPFDEDTARRKSLESAIHFETSHVLDVHQARQYPFDTYRLQIEFRAAALVANQTLPLSISRVLTVDQTSSFNVDSTDFRRYMVLNEIRSPTQRVDLHIKRPGSARLFTLLLYAISWLLTHICIGQVVIAKRGDGSRLLLCCLAICAGTLLALPQLRNSMPDAPGLDGKFS